MKTLEEIQDIVALCEYMDWDFLVSKDWPRPVLQVRAAGFCSITGEAWVWKSRKWFLSYHMCDSEIVQTVFKAVQTAVEHEMREYFKFKSAAIFGPHYDINRLVELCQSPDALDTREEAA